MAIGDTLRLGDLARCEGVTYLDDPEETVLASVALPAREVEPSRGGRRGRGAEGEPRAKRRRRAPRAKRPSGDAGSGERASPAPPRAAPDAPPWRRGERASSLDLLVVGLGNPGREYAGNRHNVGWMVVDELARRHGATWQGKFHGQLAELRLDGHRVALLKPETFMNESGRAVERRRDVSSSSSPTRSSSCTTRATSSSAVCRRVTAADLRGPQRSAARSREHLKTPDFLRLRIGVGRPGRGRPAQAADYVLSNFAAGRRRRSCSSRGPPTPSRSSTPKASSATQAQYN